ncbi:S-layer homology domain-containing protein, partial [Paenibacillus sepulcri]|nr:S-layer homology domain-containing protein [Paenibacillus sepulcri]
AVRLSSEGGLVPVLASFSSQADDSGEVTVRSRDNGVYAVISGTKSFADIQGHWAQREIENLASRLIANGITENSYAPAENVNRAEFAALLVRAIGLGDLEGRASFTDLQQDDWFAAAAG